MSTFSDTSPILIKKRKGDSTEPFKPITEDLRIVHNIAILNEIPDNFRKVNIQGMIEKRTDFYNENNSIAENEYMVDYKLGYVFFNEKMNNQTIKVEYLGTGVVLYPASRIYDSGRGDIIVTIQEMINGGREAIEACGNIDNAIKTAEEYYAKISTCVSEVKGISDTLNITIIEAKNINDVLNETIKEAININDNLNKNLSIGSNKMTEIDNKIKEFDNNENARQTTFENNESLRDEKANNMIQAFSVCEEYNSEKEYKKFNRVTFKGSSYECIKDCKNILPSFKEYWICIAEKGKDGEGSGNMHTNRYDKNDDGVVDFAEVANSIEWSNIQNKPDLSHLSKVKSVNTQIGDVIISAMDIKTIDGTTVEKNISNIQEDIKSNLSKIGNLSTLEKEIIDNLKNEDKELNITNAINYLYKNGGNSESEIKLGTIQNLTATSNIEGNKAILKWENPIAVELQRAEIYVSMQDLTSADYDYCTKNATKIVNDKIEQFEYECENNKTYFFKSFAIYSIFGVIKNSDGVITSVKVLDTKPPATVTNIKATTGNGEITLTWINPSDTDFAKVKIVRKENNKPTSESDGVVIYEGSLTTYKNTSLSNDMNYYYRFFTYDTNNNVNSTDTQFINAMPLANGYDKPISNFTAKGGNGEVILAWENPQDKDFNFVKIVRKPKNRPNNETDGLVVYEGKSTGFKDVGLTNDTQYYYRAFTFNKNNQYCDIEEGQQTNATPKAYIIYGVKIDTTNSNPESAVTYTDMAIGFTPSKGNNGNFQYGSWKDKFPFNKIKPCVYKSGKVNYYLNPNDYTKKIDGTNADIISGSDGDVMVEFPKIYWKFERIGTNIYIRISDAKVDSGYKCLAHIKGDTEQDYCYISAYLGSKADSKLRSLSEKTPLTSETIGTFRDLAQANGTNYSQMAYYQLLMLQVLFIIMFKNRDSQTALGRGYVDGNSGKTNTGATNQKGLFYGETTGKLQNKFCGIEDFYGNCYYWIDGFYCDSNMNMLIGNEKFNNTGNGYKNYGQGATGNIGGYISDIQGMTETGFLVKAAVGSVTTYYVDFGILCGGCLPCFGGNWLDGSDVGVFRLSVFYSGSDASSSIGGRSFAL